VCIIGHVAKKDKQSCRAIYESLDLTPSGADLGFFDF